LKYLKKEEVEFTKLQQNVFNHFAPSNSAVIPPQLTRQMEVSERMVFFQCARLSSIDSVLQNSPKGHETCEIRRNARSPCIFTPIDCPPKLGGNSRFYLLHNSAPCAHLHESLNDNNFLHFPILAILLC
jgi:hypothetical protein